MPTPEIANTQEEQVFTLDHDTIDPVLLKIQEDMQRHTPNENEGNQNTSIIEVDPESNSKLLNLFRKIDDKEKFTKKFMSNPEISNKHKCAYSAYTRWLKDQKF
jgi:NH3-dependent NAD+ synthetase